MKTIKGKIKSFNISPKGFYESFLLHENGQTVQINFARHSGPEAAGGLAVGQSVTVTARQVEDQRPSDHPVYEWIREDIDTREGVVKALNYARHGEVNGAILETGAFLHLRPEGAKAARLAIGQKLSFEGDVRPSPSGVVVIEARKVNGVPLDQDKSRREKKA